MVSPAVQSATRRIDELGRLVVPVAMRKRLGICDGDLLDVRLEHDRLVVAKAQPTCALCDDTNDLEEHDRKSLCVRCIDSVVARHDARARVSVSA